MYSLPGKEDLIRQKLYRSLRATPTAAEFASVVARYLDLYREAARP